MYFCQNLAESSITSSYKRAVVRSKNPGGGLVVLGGDNVPPLVEIALTDLPKTAPPPLPLARALLM